MKLTTEVVSCVEAVSEALFEDLCERKLQLGGGEEDLWVEKEIMFSPQPSDSAPSSRYIAVFDEFRLCRQKFCRIYLVTPVS